MYEFDHDPGQIEGHIVIKKTIPYFEEFTFVSGFTVKEENIGGWVGIQKKQVPLFETQKIFICNEYTWEVYTNDEYRRMKSGYNGDLFFI